MKLIVEGTVKLMELITLLIQIPTIITIIMAALNFFVLLSNRISIEKFFKIRKKLCIARWIANLIAVLGIFYFKLYDVALFMAGMMFYCAIMDIIFNVFLEKIISNKK